MIGFLDIGQACAQGRDYQGCPLVRVIEQRELRSVDG